MLNSFTIVGKVKELPVMKETSGGSQVATLMIECEKPFRNSDGTLGMHVFQVTLWKGIAQTCLDIAKVGSIVAIKGRLNDIIYKKDESKIFHNVDLVAEKVSFISV